jgi:predicted transcriptional regulator
MVTQCSKTPTNSEYDILRLLWDNGDMLAQDISKRLAYKWKKTTTYTLIQLCVEKGYIQRSEPRYMCHAILTREKAVMMIIESIITDCFSGSRIEFIACLLSVLKKEGRTDLLDEFKAWVDRL